MNTKLDTAAQRTAVYIVTGIGTEGGSTPYKLASAPGENSGYSLGVIQTDFGAKPTQKNQLASAYTAYASNSSNGVSPIANLETLLGAKGDSRSLTTQQIADVNKFLATESGKELVNGFDLAQVNIVIGKLSALENCTYFQQLNEADQFTVYATAAKVANQTGNANLIINLLINGSARDGVNKIVIPSDADSSAITDAVFALTQTYGAAAAGGAERAFNIASNFYETYSESMFDDARRHLQNAGNSLQGFDADAPARDELGALRALAIGLDSQSDYFPNKSKDPLTGHTLSFVYDSTDAEELTKITVDKASGEQCTITKPTSNITNIETCRNGIRIEDALFTPTRVFDLLLNSDILNAEGFLNGGKGLDAKWYQNITSRFTDFWLTQSPTPSVPPYNPGMGPNYDPWSDNPIGAFYESVAPVADTAPSIADKTPVILGSDTSGRVPATPRPGASSAAPPGATSR